MRTGICIYSAALVLCFVGQLIDARTESSSGTGGDVCVDRTCLFGQADCVGGKCVCKNPPFSYGNGYLNCYRKNEFRTEVTNDPRVLTYNNNSIDLPIPCRYLLTHAVTEYKDQDRKVVGSCEFMVHAFHHKAKGKFYVGGYDVAIRVECNNGSRYMMSFRKFGKAMNGQYDFTILGTDGSFLENGPWGKDDINFHDEKTNLKIRCKIDEENNLALIAAKKCGFRISFRPYDVKLRRKQPQVPGMTVGINCAYHPEFESVDRVLSLPPIGVHNGFDINSIEISQLGRVGTLMYRAYMSQVIQNQPDPNPSCSAAWDSISQCASLTQLQMAFAKCTWILTSTRFIRCYDKSESGIYIQALFNQCVDVYCSGRNCNDVVTLIEDADCLDVPDYPDKDTFIFSCITP